MIRDYAGNSRDQCRAIDFLPPQTSQPTRPADAPKSRRKNRNSGDVSTAARLAVQAWGCHGRAGAGWYPWWSMINLIITGISAESYFNLVRTQNLRFCPYELMNINSYQLLCWFEREGYFWGELFFFRFGLFFLDFCFPASAFMLLCFSASPLFCFSAVFCFFASQA